MTNNKIEDALLASKETNAVVVYKGNDTVITSPEGNVYISYKNSPSLATAGSGDVLAGMIGSFLAQQYTGIEAARLGCYIHIECGMNLNRGLIASDLVKEISNLIKKMNT